MDLGGAANRAVRCGLAAAVLLLVESGRAQQSAVPADTGPAQAGSILQRWERFYAEDWKATAASGPAPPRRGLPSPLNSPPFPNVDWSYGGAPQIGEADTNVYPLLTAIDGAKGRTKVYGWVEPTLT